MLDALENYRFDQSGFNADGPADFVNPCDTFTPNGGPLSNGRSNAADWIRTVRAPLQN